MKRIYKFLILLLVLSLTGCNSNGDDTGSGSNNNEGQVLTDKQGLVYELSSDKSFYAVVNTLDSVSKHVEIPDIFKELPVKQIKKFAFKGRDNIESIYIPDSIEKIDKYAIYECISLASINVPFVGEQNNSVNNWFGYIFGAESYNENKFMVPSSLKEVTLRNVQSIAENAFYGCNNIISLTLPYTVKEIKDNAFQHCQGLKILYYEGNISKWCNIEFSNQFSTPMYYAENFYLKQDNDFIEIKNITIPEDITSIKSFTFTGFKNLHGVVLPKHVNEIQTAAFGQSLIKVIELEGSKQFGFRAFVQCSSLEHIVFRGTLLEWCQNHFEDIYANPMCNGSNFSLIDEFGNIERPTSIIIPEELISLNPYQFTGLKQLEELVIGENIESIGGSAFSSCNNLKTITVYNSPILNSTFDYCFNVETVNIGPNVNYIEMGVFNGLLSLKSINVDSDNLYYTSIDGSLYSKDQTILFKYVNSHTLDEFIIPKSVKKIDAYSFKNHNLKRLFVSANADVIDGNAFNESIKVYLEKEYDSLYILNHGVVFYENVIKNDLYYLDDFVYILNKESNTCLISEYVGTRNVINIKDSILVNGVNYQITKIGNYAFYINEYIDFVTLPNSIEEIGDGAFSECINLTMINIPNSVGKLGSYAFSECYSLESIIVPSSVLIIGEECFKSRYGITIYCEAETKPSGWVNNFYSATATIVWGHQIEE